MKTNIVIVSTGFLLGLILGPHLLRPHPRHHLSLAYEYLIQRKNGPAAISEFSQAIHQNPKCGNNYCGRAIAFLSVGETRQAFVDLNEAMNIDPTALAYNVRANAFRAIGDDVKAQKDYDACLKLYRAMDGFEDGCIETIIKPTSKIGHPVGMIFPTNPRLLSTLNLADQSIN